MKIILVTAMWQRPEVWDMFKQGVKRLRSLYSDVEVEICVAGSEGQTSQNRCKEDWVHYVEIENNPLGRKMNAASLLAKTLNPDYCLLVGSDDIINNELFDLYLDSIDEEIDYTYLMDGFFYDITTKQSLYWGGYNDKRKGDSLGAGRLLSKSLLDRLEWKMWYDVKLSGMLDSAMDEKMSKLKYTSKEIWLRDSEAILLDIKSSTNMTPFKQWNNSAFIDTKYYLGKFPNFELNKIINGTKRY